MSFHYTWLYLVYDRFTGWTKIGRSDNPSKRFQELVREPTLMPLAKQFILQDAWLMPLELESQLHERYADKRMRGEWFALESSDKMDIGFLCESAPRWQYAKPERIEELEIYVSELEDLLAVNGIHNSLILTGVRQ